MQYTNGFDAASTSNFLIGLMMVEPFIADILQSPGLLGAIFRLIEAPRNDIRSQPQGNRSQPAGAGGARSLRIERSRSATRGMSCG
jgi:hypothetical protein